MEGNRQRWAAIFIVAGFIVLAANIRMPSLDPVPYMHFLMMVGSLFILGASASDWVKTYNISSVKNTQIKHEVKGELRKTSSPDIETALSFEKIRSDDQSYAPQYWVDKQEVARNFR